ncbi:hypothetical protein DMP17_02240 [Pseudonocardia sp. TMWB2A]
MQNWLKFEADFLPDQPIQILLNPRYLLEDKADSIDISAPALSEFCIINTSACWHAYGVFALCLYDGYEYLCPQFLTVARVIGLL